MDMQLQVWCINLAQSSSRNAIGILCKLIIASFGHIYRAYSQDMGSIQGW